MAEEKNDIQSYVDKHRKSGLSDQDIATNLLKAGWSQAQVDGALGNDVPPPPPPAVTNVTSAQTSSSGTPLQVENVQYNMSIKPVESKVGLYIKIASTGLWLTVIFVCAFLSALISKAGGESSDLGAATVMTLSLSVIAVPIFIIAYKKFLAEQANNPATTDDLFFKKHVRRGLWFSIVLGSLCAFSFLYGLLSTAFLENGDSSYSDAFTALVFALGFGGIVFFYWRLHARTKR